MTNLTIGEVLGIRFKAIDSTPTALWLCLAGDTVMLFWSVDKDWKDFRRSLGKVVEDEYPTESATAADCRVTIASRRDSVLWSETGWIYDTWYRLRIDWTGGQQTVLRLPPWIAREILALTE